MASGGAEEDDGDVPMDTDNVHMLLQGTAECEQVQKRTVTTWMNAQMAETPVVLCNDVRSKAQSMARGRLEKARVRLQEHIQCAIMLFGGKEISQTEAKKKERALTVLQPLVLQEFLDAVEALGAFCSEAQLQDLMLHSDSVRKQWEDVCREMAAFFPMLWSKVREDQSCSAVQSQTHTNTLLEATDRTDHACSQGQQDVPTDREDQLAQHGEQHPKPSLPAREQRLKAPFLLMADSSDGALSHTQSLCTSPISQAVVRSDADETKQPAEWTVIPKLVKVTRDTSRQQGEAERQLERHSWQGAMQQRLQPAGGQSESTDRKLTHQEVLTSLHKHASDMETKLIGSKHTENKDEINPAGHELMQRDEDFSPVEVCPTEPEDASSQQGAAQAQQHLTSSGEEGESVLEAARSKLDGESETKMQREGEHRVQTWWTGGGDVEEEQGRSRMEGLVQRRDALLEALREIKGAAEQLRLHEPTLPAVQQRTRALTELDSRLAGLLSELRHIRAASSSGVTDMSQSDELEDAWEETTKDVTFRLEQCCVVTELLKRFQCVRAELSGTLQAAERTISEQASHMAKDNLLRLYSKVKERKAELKSLGVGIEEVRSVCRQLHTHLRQTPGCSLVPFQSEADALMDGWLDISERTDSHLESLQLALTLWDGVLQLGAEVEKWTGDRIAVFAETPSFQSEDDIQALQNEIVAQEKSVERFQQRAIEIQSLLHSSEPPLELQVAETQMRKKLEQLKELLSEAEEVFWQTVAAEGQMSARTAECFRSLGNIRESLLSLGGTDAAVVLAKLQDLGRQLQIQDQLAESLLEDLHVLTSISSHRHLQNLSAQVLQLQEGVRASHQLFSEVEEQTRHNIQDLDRLQSASVHLEQWLHIAEDTAEQEEDLLQEEVPQLRVRTEVFSQPLSSLQSSNIQRVPPVDESRRPLERYNTLHTPGQHFQVGDQSPHVDSPLRESPSIQSPEEQRRHHVQDLEEDVKTEERFGQLLQDCCHKLTSLQERLSACQAQTGSSARLFAHNPASEELLQEASALEKDIVQLVTLKDLIADRLTVEAEANVSRQISKLQHHKRALDSSIRESLAPLSEDSIQKVKVEISCVETAVKNLAENIASLSVDQEELPDLSQLKQQRCTIQDFENRLMELAAAIHSLQRTGGSNVMRAMLPADVTLNADGAVKDFDSLRSTFRHKKHQCAENTAHRVREVVRQLQHWNQTVQAEPSPCSQAALDEGLQLQKHLRDVLSDTDLLLNVLGAHASKELEEHASHALSESTRALESLSQRLVAPTVTYNTRAGHSPPCSPSPPHTVSEAACDANLTDVSSPEENPALLSKLIGPKADERDSTKLSEPRELTLNVSLSSSKPNGTCTECQTTFHDVKQEVTGSRQSEKETVSSGLCAAGSSLQTSTETAVADETQLTGADGAESAREELTAGRNAIETGSGEGLQSKHPEELERRDNMTPLNGAERDSVLPASLEATQRQTLEGTEPERTPLPLSADPGLARERAAPDNHRPIMQDIFEIQSLVERSNIINRTPHIDLNWYLKSSPGEPQIRLVRTVQRVLACRYQPAQLDLTAMIKQLEEAEEYRSRVQELIATTKSTSAAMGCDPDASERAARQCREALLDASATVQVKAAQLDQVKRFHNQMRMTRAFLEVVAAEKEKLSLDTLGSSAAQADKFTALLQTMALKKHMMEELLHLSGQFSVHLSDAESSGALLAQLGDVQEEWRLLEGSIKRALRHATNSTAQASVLIKEAEELHVKLEELQKSSLQGNDSKSALELVCLTTDLKLYNQLFLYLTSQSNALVHFSLGQKEKDKIQTALQELGSLLDVTKRKLDSCNCSCAAVSSARMNKQLQDLIIWAKQAENHVSTGRKLALFPEEARNQIVDMRKFQTDILSRRSKMKAQVEEMKEVACDTEKEESDQILKTIEDLYEAIADSLDHVLDNMKKQLQVREKLLSQLDSLDAWLAESHTTRDAYGHVDNVSKADMQTLESELESRRLASVEIQRQLEVVETMEESCKDIAAGLSPGESRYLVNRLSGLWTGLDGLLAHEKATSWELEELIHERTSSQKELSTIRSSLKQISTDLEQQRFPLTRETLLTVARVMHMLMENQCQVQELQHCQEAERSALLCAIGDLQEKCKALSLSACEQDKYLHLRRQVEESRDIVKEQMQRARDETLKVGERFRLCQTLLVEVPLVKTQCQEAGDQLEAVAQDLLPSELNSERQRIRHVVETLVSWEHSVTEDVRGLEAQLLPSLRFSGELSAFMDLLQRTKEELEAAKPVSPEEKEVDCALRRCWVLWRNTQSGMRVLEALGQEDKINLKDHKELYSLRDAVMEACHLQMESLSQARESLKDYQWAAQGAISFLHHAEATFLSAPGGFLDCTEELRQTQQALEALEEGLQAHICHLVELFPQRPRLSQPACEQLHISILSQLLVGRSVLEAQAQLRLESLQGCAVRQQSHRSCHEDIRQRLSGFEARLQECAAAHVTSHDKCVAQQKTAARLMEDLRRLAGKTEELRAGCPMQGCGVGKDGELGALWRRWVSLRRGVGLLMAHAEQRQEEWKDITTSLQQCCSLLANLQAEVPDSSAVSFTQENPQDLLAHAEVHQASLEQEQQALASLEHRLEHALSLSTSQGPISPGPVGKTLVKIQDNIRSLKERNLLVVAAAQAEEKERQRVQEEIGALEKHMFAILPKLEACSEPSQQQELREDLSSHQAKLKCIMDDVQSRYAEIPADISKSFQEAQRSLQRVEEELAEGSSPARKLAGRVSELGSGLEKVQALLEQKSPTVSEAQNVLKRVWDELDSWRSRLMLLESEVQDLAEEKPDQAHLLMDHLTQPLQLYQNTSQMVESRTSFVSKIPACLQEFEDILYSATCWLDEAQAWLSAPCSFTTARSLQSHAKSLQLVLDDSERIGDMLQDFRPVLAEISSVCDVSAQEDRLDQNDQRVHKMQRVLLEPLEQLLQAAVVVQTMENELKTMEKNVSKIRTILSSMDDSNITPSEHHRNRQVILANVQSIRGTLEDMERCKGELRLPQGADENMVVFSQARQLLQRLEELDRLTRYQVSLLENKIRMEEENRKEQDVSSVPEATQSQDTQRRVQEPFDVSNSEEEEDEDDESCHSSSSDTLTCSIPEDPEETLVLPDVKSENVDMMPLSSVKELKSSADSFSSEVEMSSESGLLSVKPVSDTNDFTNAETGSTAVEAHVDGSTCPEALRAELVISGVTPEAEDLCGAADTQDRHDESLQPAAAASEETRLIPTRPITPFMAAAESAELITEEDEALTLSTAPHQHVDTFHVSEEQSDASHKVQESSKVQFSLGGHEEEEKDHLRWSGLNTQVSQKLTTLKKVQQEYQSWSGSEVGGGHEKAPDKELTSTGSAAAVLQCTQESITMLRKIASADCSRPHVREELYEAVWRILLSLDAWTDFLQTGEEDLHLRMLQQECVSSELTTLAELLNKVESEIRPVLLKEEPEALCSLTCLEDCLSTVQLLFTSSLNQLSNQLGLEKKPQFFYQLCLLDDFDLGHSETNTSLKDAPSLEQRVLGKHLRGSSGGKAKLQPATQALLQGITHLLELGEESIKERQMSQVHNLGQLQDVLCRRKVLLLVLGSQLAFLQHLFRREPEALRCQEAERLQLEVRAKALQQQALGQEVASQRSLREWILWEDSRGRLVRMLDEFEALVSTGEPEGDATQQRLNNLQKTQVQLDEGRAALGLFLDQCKVPQTEPVFTGSVRQAGVALELRWRGALRRTEQEIQRCRDVQEIQARFHTDSASLSDWLLGANKRLKSWSEPNQECVGDCLLQLLDFSMKVEAMSQQKASVSRRASQLLHLREADCPGLRSGITQLEVTWDRVTSDLAKIQDQLHQLIADWPPVELLSDLEVWLKKLEAALSRETETSHKAKDAAQITEILQHYQVLKAGVVSGQLLLDFLCQSGPQAAGADVQALRSERTAFAETLGRLRLQLLHVQEELETQIRGAEQMRHTCAVREKQLKRRHGWIMQQKEQLDQWERPTSQTLVRTALTEWQAVGDKLKEVAAAVQTLKATQVHVDEEEKHPCDILFSNQAQSVIHVCEDLCQQMEVLRPALQQTDEKWICFDMDLQEATLRAAKVHCALQHHRAPLFSPHQAEGYRDFLQELQGEADKGQELWAAVEKSCLCLVKTVHCGTAKVLSDRVEGEKTRWTDTLRELKDEHVKTGETVSMWQEYRRLFDDSSLRLQHIRLQWEELLSSLRSSERDTPTMVQSVETLQDVAEKLKSSIQEVLEASRPLSTRLEPLASNLVQSETRLLSCDVQLLVQVMSARKKSLQEEVDDQKLFRTRLQTLEKQTQIMKDKLAAGIKDKDSLKQVLSELSDLFPSLVDVRDMRRFLTLNKQEAEELHVLCRDWSQITTHTCDTIRELQAEHQSSQSFQEKRKNLVRLKEELVEESTSQQPESHHCLTEILSVHQRLQAKVVTGHQLLQGLLCDAVTSTEGETGERRSETVAQVSSMKEAWFNAVRHVDQCRSLAKEKLRQHSTYHHGLKLLWKLLREVDPLLPPAGPAPCALSQLQSRIDDYQCVEEALDLHSAVYNQTLEAGKHLTKTTTQSECQLQSELQAIEEAWKRTTSLLESRKGLVEATLQKWCRCQEGITSIMSDLNELKTKVKQQLHKRPENKEFIQETELSLLRLASGLRDLGTMKTDLSHYMAATDSALLEQQLEQLQAQWEELCMKVSLRRQEISDHLNAWTIFNDKNKEFCDWLTQTEKKVCHSGDLSIEEMVEKLKKDCMEEINLFSENKSHLKQLGEQLLLASDEAKQTQVHGSLQEVNQRWHNVFHHIEARVKKLTETLVTVQQLDKNMSNLRSWLSRMEAELFRPITYSVCHHQEIQRRLAEQQELQQDIEQHTEGVASVLSLCDVLLCDEDAAGGVEAESDSLQETSRCLDRRWRTICAMALDRRLRIEETWRLWCKFLDDYSRFEDWLKMAESTAANPNSAGVLYTVAKEELKKFEGFQRQVHERLTQLEIVNNQYRRLARENRTDRASQLKAMVHEGNWRWDTLHRRVAAILRRLKYFTSQREEFEGTRESMLVWLTQLDLQLTNVEHFSESDVHHKIQQLNSFQKEITLNTERIDGLIVFGEGLIQRSSPHDAALIEDELEELHTYCQEVFSRLVRFHQRLSQPPMVAVEPKLPCVTFSLESSLELIGRPWLGRGHGSLPATPTHLLASPLERSGCETPVSVDSLPLEWDHTGDVGGSSTHEDEDDEEEHEEEGTYFSTLSAPSRSMVVPGSPLWGSRSDTGTHSPQLDSEGNAEAAPKLTSTPLKQGYLGLTSQCTGSIEDIKRVSLILDDDERTKELGLTGLTASDKQSGVIERWELLQAQSRSNPQADGQEHQQLTSDLDDLTSWLDNAIPQLDRLQLPNPTASIADMESRARELKEMQRMFTHYKSIMLSVNLRAQAAPDLQEKLASVNAGWSRVCTGLQQWDISLRTTLTQCKEFHETLHSLLLWLAHAESRRYAVDISNQDTPVRALQQHRNTLTDLQEELWSRETQQASLQALWSQLRPDTDAEDSEEAQEKLHVTGSKLKLLLREVDQDLSTLQQQLSGEAASDVKGQPPPEVTHTKKDSSTPREMRASPPPRSFFYRVLRAAFPLHLLLLLLLLLPCLIPLSESHPSCTVANNFARSFYPMLHYTNGPPPT